MKIYKLLIFLLLFLILFLLCSIYNSRQEVFIKTTAILTDSDEQLTIMSYNIHHGIDSSEESNLNQIAALINAQNIDIVGLNEVDRGMLRTGFQDQAQLLAEKTGLNYVFGANLRKLVGTYGNALLTRFPILEAENHQLPQINGNEPRGLLDATLFLSDNQQIRVLVTHLSVDLQERQLQIDWIENYLSQIKTPFFLLGDFNDEMTTLLEIEPIIKDTNTFPASQPANQTDYIFSNIQLINYESKVIISEASDHLPVVITGEII